MAAFASCRRSGWVRVLVVILCALFIFATLGAPPAQALGVESVAVFGLASVLSAATAALGFKLASNEQGQATLQKMLQDFKTVAWATGFVLVGSKLNGLQNGMDYIKMQVKEGKTYLDARVFAWVQQWLSNNGVYGTEEVSKPSDWSELWPYSNTNYKFSDLPSLGVTPISFDTALKLCGWSDFNFKPGVYDSCKKVWNSDHFCFIKDNGDNGPTLFYSTYSAVEFDFFRNTVTMYGKMFSNGVFYDDGCTSITFKDGNIGGGRSVSFHTYDNYAANFLRYNIVSDNNSGLSGSDTIGADYKDKTLDQTLAGLKEWAKDWFDAGADSATNAATGALDLPLTVATGAATANPSIAEDGPLVWFPPFSVPIPNLRTGETDTKTVDQGKENASAAETSTVDVAENQSVIDSLVNWALGYISPDTGLFSKFPLCVPYDAYLLVTSSLGVDSVGSDSIFGASPGDLDGVVNQDIETYSDFQPIINIKHDFQLDGATYPIELTIDLTPWQPLVTFFREGMALLLVAELIGAEFKRIRGIK